MIEIQDDSVILNQEELIVIAYADPVTAKWWIELVEKEAKAEVEYRCRGGRLHIYYHGDKESRARVVAAVRKLELKLESWTGGFLIDVCP